MVRWRRVFALGGALSALCGVGLGVSLWLNQPEKPKPFPPFESRAALRDEQQLIIAALVDAHLSGRHRTERAVQADAVDGKAPSPGIVVIESGLRFCEDNHRSQADSGDCALSLSLEKGILSRSFGLDYDVRPDLPLAFRKALIDANRTSRKMPIALDSGVASASSQDIHALIGDRFWSGFYDRYPDAIGVLVVSWAVVSRDGRQALIYGEHRCGGLCGTGNLYRLARARGHWRVENTFGLWIS